MDVEAQLAVHAQRLEALEREVQRSRERLHELTAATSAVRLLRQEVENLTANLPNLARQAARETVTELLNRRHADTLANLRTYAAILGAGIALGALIVQLVH